MEITRTTYSKDLVVIFTISDLNFNRIVVQDYHMYNAISKNRNVHDSKNCVDFICSAEIQHNDDKTEIIHTHGYCYLGYLNHCPVP